MLTIHIKKTECFDNSTQTFIQIPEQTLCLEHSLISISRWESKWKKAYFSKDHKTKEEVRDYIRCMSVNKDIPQAVIISMTQEQLNEINAYILDPMTATTFAKDNTPPTRKINTAEVIYSQMVALHIPFDCEKWHINRLLTLIKVCALENQPPKKMGKKELVSRNSALNNQRRQQYNTRG